MMEPEQESEEQVLEEEIQQCPRVPVLYSVAYHWMMAVEEPSYSAHAFIRHLKRGKFVLDKMQSDQLQKKINLVEKPLQEVVVWCCNLGVMTDQQFSTMLPRALQKKVVPRLQLAQFLKDFEDIKNKQLDAQGVVLKMPQLRLK